MLAGILIGLGMWIWLFFDYEAYKQARKTSAVIVQIPPPIEIKKTKNTSQESLENRSNGHGDTLDNAVGHSLPSYHDDAGKVLQPLLEEVSEGDKNTEKKESITGSQSQDSVKLVKAPLAELVKEETEGLLPVIAPDGRKAWKIYSRPFEDKSANKAKIALVMAGLGLSEAATEAAIQQLPGAVTLSFVPYSRELSRWIAHARAAGHEVLLELPMEPENYPKNDPGPHTLLTSLGPDENTSRLNWLLGRFTGYVGVTSFMGERFKSTDEAIRPILSALGGRGLLYFESNAQRKGVITKLGAELSLPHVTNNHFIDGVASRIAIDTHLLELERIAQSSGSAVGVGFPYPVTIERVSKWAQKLRQKNYVLTPLSAMAGSRSEK